MTLLESPTVNLPVLKSPFPWFGGKSRATPLIWSRLGDTINYVEPFAGSLSTVLLRQGYDPLRHTETVNDLDCYIANFWRALSFEPEAVAHWADSPVNEADLHSRHLWLVTQADFQERMKTDPDYFDVKIAGWWVWGVSLWIGSGWCANRPRVAIGDASGNNGKRVHRQLPHLGDNGKGVHRQLPHLGNNGKGVHRKRPHLLQSEPFGSQALLPGECSSPASSLGGQRDGGSSQASETPDVYQYFAALASRLRRVRVCCGDWQRVLGASPTEKIGITGILLDPPYDQTKRESQLYAVETMVSAQVREWAITHGDNPRLRIALCGYADEHEMPESWECVAWKAGGGYDGQRRTKDNHNRKKERIWFSPHCLKPQTADQLNLFA